MKNLTFGFIAGFLIFLTILAAKETPQPPPVVTTCEVQELGAQRCDQALLTCLSVQVRFLRELENVSNTIAAVCK